jgi:hypothetical protein
VIAIAAPASIAGPAHSTPATDSTLCTPVRYRVGEGSVDEGVGHVHPIRNESGAAARRRSRSSSFRSAQRAGSMRPSPTTAISENRSAWFHERRTAPRAIAVPGSAGAVVVVACSAPIGTVTAAAD